MLGESSRCAEQRRSTVRGDERRRGESARGESVSM